MSVNRFLFNILQRFDLLNIIVTSMLATVQVLPGNCFISTIRTRNPFGRRQTPNSCCHRKYKLPVSRGYRLKVNSANIDHRGMPVSMLIFVSNVLLRQIFLSEWCHFYAYVLISSFDRQIVIALSFHFHKFKNFLNQYRSFSIGGTRLMECE